MGAQKFRKRMAKFKIIFLSIALCWSLPVQAYDIDELVKILIDKNENNSSFKYDDQIDDISLDNADKIYIPEIDYKYSFSNTTSSTSSTSTVNSNTNTISATVNLYNGGFSQLSLIATQTRNQALDYLSCLLYTSPSPRDRQKSRMPSSA